MSTSFNFATTLPNTPYSNLYIHVRVTSADGQVRNSVHTIYIQPGLGPFRLASTVDLDNNNITVYPVPVQDKATIIFETENSGKGKILVQNSFGTVIKQDYFEHESGNV